MRRQCNEDRYHALVFKVLESLAYALLLALLLTATSLAVAPTPSYAQEFEPTEQCVDFSDWKERKVGPKFVKDGVGFSTVAEEWTYVTGTPGGTGLQIPQKGINIGFPQPVSQIVLCIILGTSVPLQVTAFNHVGTVVGKVTIPSTQGIVHTVTLTGREIVTLAIEGGRNNGYLIEICIESEVEQPPEQPLVEAVKPAEGRCGSEVTLTVFGANFEKWWIVSIPDGVETIYTEFISPEEFRVRIFITENAMEGIRPLEVIDPERGVVVAALKVGFTVVCPAPEPEELPDLALVSLDWDIVEEGCVLVIAAQVENAGDAQAPEAIVRAASQAAEWWAAETTVPELNSGNSARVLIELEIPDEPRGMDHLFRVCVDPWDETTEWSEDNNCQDIEVWIPGADEDQTELIPIIIIVVSITVAGITLTIRRNIKVRRRKEWQEKAKEEEPPDTCQPCTHHCHKIEIELEPSRRKATHFTLVAYDPSSGKKSQEEDLKGDVVDEINKAIMAHRQRQQPEELQRLVAQVAKTLSQQIREWLRLESSSRDVSVSAHLVGGKVTFQFILYHCKQRGNVNIWEEEDKWKKTVKDERDEPVGMLRSLDPTKLRTSEWLVSELTRLLMQFTERV